MRVAFRISSNLVAITGFDDMYSSSRLQRPYIHLLLDQSPNAVH